MNRSLWRGLLTRVRPRAPGHALADHLARRANRASARFTSEVTFLRRDLVYCTYEQNVMAWPSHARQTSCTWACPRRPSSASSQSRVRQIHLRRGSLGTDTRSVRCAVTTAAVAAHQPRAGSLSKVRQIPLRRGNLGMDARCAGAAAAIAILLLLP